MASAELQSQISSLLERYISAFNASDLAAAASYYDEPSVMVSADGGVKVLSTQRDYVSAFETAMERLKAAGWERSEYVGEKSIAVLDAGLLMASCPCKRLRGDGSSVEEFTAVYTLRKVGEEWVICAIHHAEFGKVLKV